jgi:hypothetical protein
MLGFTIWGNMLPGVAVLFFRFIMAKLSFQMAHAGMCRAHEGNTGRDKPQSATRASTKRGQTFVSGSISWPNFSGIWHDPLHILLLMPLLRSQTFREKRPNKFCSCRQSKKVR